MNICGIDIGKRQHSVILIDERGHITESAFTITNDRIGFDQLHQVLARQNEPIHVALEATGHYWLALYEQLSQRGYRVTVLNALQVRAYRKIGMRKRKTDRIDAQWIAEFVRFAQPVPTLAQTPQVLQLRELARFHFRLIQQIGDCKRKILSILDRVFPEYETLFSNVFLASSRQLLQHAVLPEEFAAFDVSELAQVLKRASRGRFGQAKAAEIQMVAQTSVGITFLRDAVQVEMQCLLAQMSLLDEQRDAVQSELEKLMAALPQFLTTIDGIGLVTGAMLLGEIGDVKRFDCLEKLVAYAGIDATVFQSGQFQGDQMHMSKRGSPYLRYALWQAATACLLHNAELKTYYDKKRAEGKAHGVALGAVCRKLLARIYVVLRDQRPYVVR